MNHLDLLESSLRALLRNRTRSLLTVLGITIGIAAVICVVAIGKAGQAEVERRMSSLGDNYVWIEAGGRDVNGVQTGPHTTPTLTVADAVAIGRQVPLIRRISPNIDAASQVIYAGRNWNTVWRGVSPAYFDIKRWYPEQGALFGDEDVQKAAGVCVIGRTVRDRLFGPENPVGKVIRVGRLPCEVVAVLQPKGLSLSGQDQDDQVILPYTTAQQKLKGTIWLDDIVGSAVSQDSVKAAGQQAAEVLRDRHRLGPGEGDDFIIRNPEEVVQAQMAASRSLANLLIAVASVSLLVGGIGIMNVMLVSVTERTREIGVRLAVGATEDAIKLQFLGESVMLSLMGGGAGVLAGIIGSYVIGKVLDWAMMISPLSIVVAVVFCVAVGVFFGFYPARKASMLNPAEVLRHE
jgi:putative ABC transport system permease protein